MYEESNLKGLFVKPQENFRKIYRKSWKMLEDTLQSMSTTFRRFMTSKVVFFEGIFLEGTFWFNRIQCCSTTPSSTPASSFSSRLVTPVAPVKKCWRKQAKLAQTAHLNGHMVFSWSKSNKWLFINMMVRLRSCWQGNNQFGVVSHSWICFTNPRWSANKSHQHSPQGLGGSPSCHH